MQWRMQYHVILDSMIAAPHCTTGLVCIYASVNEVIMDSGNGLAHMPCQAITWTNTSFLH